MGLHQLSYTEMGKTHAGFVVRDKQAKLEVFQWTVFSFQLGHKNFSRIGKFSFTLKAQ